MLSGRGAEWVGVFGLLLALSVGLIGCDRGEAGRRRLVVFAASSLTEAMGELERAFERAHPAIDVQLAFAGSGVLRLQIEQGAHADVFASADVDHMRALTVAGRVHEARVFAHNGLVVIVPRDDPAQITAFGDLPRAKRLVIGGPTVPVGRYTRLMLDRAAASLGAGFAAAVRANVVSEENNVRLVRAKVELGEADAAVVYHTDAVASKRVRIVPVPAAFDVRADYLIGLVEGSAATDEARRWVAFVASEAGRRVLARHGFGLP